MYEPSRPSILLITLSLLPIPLIISVFYLTDNFSLKPHLPPLYHAIAPAFLLVFSIALSVFAFITAKDEEPEWGPVLPFKVIEGACLSYIVISAILLALVVLRYFLRAPT